MKKLMIAACVIALAAVSQAAAMKWASGAIKQPGSSTAASVANTSVQYILLTTEQYTALDTAVAGLTTGNDVSKYIYDNYNGKTVSDSTTTANKGALTTVDKKAYGNGDVVSAVIIYTAKDGDGNDNFIANYGQWVYSSDQDKTAGSMGLNVKGNLASDARTLSWQSVPEPTSGLLLLLGVAGLALRRRRA